jgi:hypothetical protein
LDDLHVTIEPERIVTSTLILRSWSGEDAQAAFEIYGDPGTAVAIRMRKPVCGLAEMRKLLWDGICGPRPVVVVWPARLGMLWRTRRFSRATSRRSSSPRRHETREASPSPGVSE